MLSTQPPEQIVTPHTVEQEKIDAESLNLEATRQSANQNWLSGTRGMFIGIGIGVILTLIGTKIGSFATKPTTTPTPEQPVKAEVTAQSVTVTTAQITPVDRTLKATGTVAAVELIPVLSRVMGLQIQQVLVDEGDTVKAGHVLLPLDNVVQLAQVSQAQATVAQAQARLDELRAGTRAEEIARARETIRRMRAEVSQAQSDWELAKKRVERNQTLESEGAIARDLLDEILTQEKNKLSILQQKQASVREAEQKLAELEAGPRQEVIAQAVAQLAEAKARLQVVNTELNNTRIVAPVNGLIAERNARVGDTTNASGQTPLFRIIENGLLELRLKVPETELPLIRVGQKVEIVSDTDTNLKITGTVREINPVVDEQSRQATIEVNLPNQKGLKPGMFLRGNIITNTATSLTVPMQAVLPQTDGSAIAYVVQNNNTVKAQTLTLGELLPNQQVEVLAGLNPNDRLVLKGAAYLKDGDRITIQPE